MKRTVMVAKHPTTRHLATAMPESRSTKTPRPHQRQESAPDAVSSLALEDIESSIVRRDHDSATDDPRSGGPAV